MSDDENDYVPKKELTEEEWEKKERRNQHPHYPHYPTAQPEKYLLWKDNQTTGNEFLNFLSVEKLIPLYEALDPKKKRDYSQI